MIDESVLGLKIPSFAYVIMWCVLVVAKGMVRVKFDVSVGGDVVGDRMVGRGDDCDVSGGIFVDDRVDAAVDRVDAVVESEVDEDIIELFVEAELAEGDGVVSGG